MIPLHHFFYMKKGNYNQAKERTEGKRSLYDPYVPISKFKGGETKKM